MIFHRPTLVLLCCLQACSGGGEASKSKADTDDSSADATSSETNTTTDPGAFYQAKDIAEMKAKCWVALGPTYLGFGLTEKDADSRASQFPNTNSGNRISSGEQFDNAGGSYLGPQKTAHRYPKAVNSLAVAPGMHVEVRDQSDAILFQADGPDMILSSEEGGDLNWLGAKFQGIAGRMPGWMKEYMQSRNYQLRRIPLQDARVIKATRIIGKSCD